MTVFVTSLLPPQSLQANSRDPSGPPPLEHGSNGLYTQGPPRTQSTRTLVPDTLKGMILGARGLKYWVLGASGWVKAVVDDGRLLYPEGPDVVSSPQYSTIPSR